MPRDYLFPLYLFLNMLGFSVFLTNLNFVRCVCNEMSFILKFPKARAPSSSEKYKSVFPGTPDHPKI